MLILLTALISAQALLPGASGPDIWHQIGPNPRSFEPSPLPIPRRKRATEVPPPMPGATTPATQTGIPTAPVPNSTPRPTRYTICLAAGDKDPAAGIAAARAWLAEAAKAATPDTAHGAAAQCLGQLLLQQGDSAGAEAAFAESAGQVPADNPAAAAALQAMAGNAALAGGRAETALGWYDKALAPLPANAPSADDNAVRGAVQIGRARALVALDRLPEASGALQEAHRLAPGEPEGWLFSATLARRGKDLERAQRDIEVAASLIGHGDPLGVQIGLEAGVIAMLSGREDAARRSWESVVALAPDSPEAATAKGYLDQIGPSPASSAPAAASGAPPETSR